MKKTVIANWLQKKEIENHIIIDRFNEMISSNKFVGFIPKYHDNKIHNRYMVITGGQSGLGLAVQPDGAWINSVCQKEEDGTYYVFDTIKELYEWLLNG